MFYPELKGNALAAYKDLVNKLIKQASLEILKINWSPGMPIPEGLVVRPMRPEDIGVTNPEWYFTGFSATSWNTIVSDQTIADNRFVGIYAVQNQEDDPKDACELKITRAGRTCRYWPISYIINFENQIGYADDPISIPQNTKITVECWSRDAGTVTGLGLVGVVVEKKGLLINP